MIYKRVLQIVMILSCGFAAFGQGIFPCTAASPYPQPMPVQNDTSTGTTLFKLADISSGNAILSSHSNNAGAIGVVVAGAGTSGTACVAYAGPTPLYVDGTTTAGDCVVRSSTTDGEGHDTGSACTTYPASGEFIGVVMQASTGANSLSVILYRGAFTPATGGATTNQNIRTITAVFDGGGSALTGPQTSCSHVNYAGTINQIVMVADVSGTATVQVETVSYASYTGPSSASDISSGGETMTSAVKKKDSTLTGWTTSLSADTVVCVVLTSPATLTKLSVDVKVAAN